MKRILFAVVAMAILLAGCVSAAGVASSNLSQAANSFEVNRRIVFYNGITGEYMLVIEGLCATQVWKTSDVLTVTCKVGADEYKKHYLGLSDNVTYFAEQIEPVAASIYHYRVIFKPSVIIPDIDLQ